MPFAAALSEHPVPAHAVGEVAGEVLDQFGERPDLAFVFVTPPFAGALEDTVAAIDDILHPLVLLGAAAESIVGPHREVEQTAAVSLFAARTGPLLPMALTAVDHPGQAELTVTGWPDDIAFTPQALLLVADPFSFPADRFLQWVGARYPGLPVVGGMASAAHAPGGNRLAIGRRILSAGAVGVLLGPGVGVETVVSQGCRPFGQPVVVTRSDGNVILELAGTPALERLVAQAQGALTEEEVALLEMGGLQIGRVIDEHRESFGRGDFLLRSVLGADRRSGAIAVGDVMPVGTTVQFHLRDARTADEDLHVLLKGHRADGALVFTCNGRGSRLFDEPHHDVRVLTDLLGPVPLAGCFAAGEIGPVGGQNFVHGFTASMALLRDTAGSPG
jgi:small ligand-binding sensory domain FIST